MRGKIVVDLHKAQSDQAVKPCVGNFFHHLCIALASDLLHKLLALSLLIRSQGASSYGYGVYFSIAFCSDSILIRSLLTPVQSDLFLPVLQIAVLQLYS